MEQHYSNMIKYPGSE